MANAAMRIKTFAHILEIDWAMMLVNLNGIASAKGNVRPAGTGQMKKLS